MSVDSTTEDAIGLPTQAVRGTARGFAGEHDEEFDESARAIQQGDVLEFLRQDVSPLIGAHHWSSHYCVVVTANCDLAHNKHGGLLSVVPIVPLSVYAANIAVPRITEPLVETARADLRRAVPRRSGWPTQERLLELLRDGVDSAAISQFVPEEPEKAEVLELLAPAEACAQWERALKLSTKWEDLVLALGTFLAALHPAKKRRPDGGQLVRRELKNRLIKSLPGDALFLSALAPGVDDGYVAYLRVLRELTLTQIATSAIEERRASGTIVVRRVGRLAPLYLHRLTQQLAAVFTAIGLPVPYEEHRDVLLGMILEDWTANCK